MSDSQQTVRVFISSPGDVVEERDQTRRVIEGLQRKYPGVTLQPVLWEEFSLPATASFQETIDVLLETQPIDVAVFILWSRLGSPLGAAIPPGQGDRDSAVGIESIHGWARLASQNLSEAVQRRRTGSHSESGPDSEEGRFGHLIMRRPLPAERIRCLERSICEPKATSAEG